MAGYKSAGSWTASFQKLNIVTSAALMIFAVLGLIMTGLAGDLIDLLEQYQYLPMAASFGVMMVIFASSDARDVRYYHPVEAAIVTVCVVFMVAYGALTEVQDVITQYEPWSSILVLALMMVTGAILAR